MAYGMTSQIKKACEKIKKDGDNLKHSTGDYIQHELNLSPSKQAAKKFYTEVDTLHNQIDLLEAKLRKLEEERIPRCTTNHTHSPKKSAVFLLFYTSQFVIGTSSKA